MNQTWRGRALGRPPVSVGGRCWVHKMRNILEKARKRDYDEMKAGAQAIYLAESRAQAVVAFRAFRLRWGRAYSAMVRRLQQDLPELLSFFAFSPGTSGANSVSPT